MRDRLRDAARSRWPTGAGADRRDSGTATAYAADWRPRFADAYRLELQAWIDALAAGAPPPLPTARDGLAATASPRPSSPRCATAGASSRSPRLTHAPSRARRPPDPMAAPALRWGVLGSGWIAERFIGSLQRHTRQQVLAVGSRDAARAAAFAAGHGIPRATAPTPTWSPTPTSTSSTSPRRTPSTSPCARLALEAGKPVLVEKPIGLNAAQATEIAQLAADRGLFCMEALWTFFLPSFDVVRQLLDAGALGEVRTVLADMGEHFTAEHRIMRADLAGGPLLDLGTYPVALATWVLGAPEQVLAAGQDATRRRPQRPGPAVLRRPDGSQAALHTTVHSGHADGAVAGTGGHAHPRRALLPARRRDSEPGGGEPRGASEPRRPRRAALGPPRPRGIAAGSRLRRCARSPTRSRPRAIDEIRRQIGVTYLEESAPGFPQ